MSDSVFKPRRAFILAAGFGTRLRPYTDHCPKPMVEVGGRSLIMRIFDQLCDAGVCEVVVNLHYRADQLRAHLETYTHPHFPAPKIYFSHEDPILDTGGGIRKMLDVFEDEPFYVIAGDALWTDPSGGEAALARLARLWDAEQMDILTLMQPLSRMVLTEGAGDYDVLPDGRVVRSKQKVGAYMWTNIRLNAPVLYRDAPEGAFSFLNLMDKAQEQGRFYALEHEGDWHHISSPRDLEAVRSAFEYDDVCGKAES